MKFLLIDDTKAVHAYIKSLFKENDHEFDDAYNGQEGIEMLKSGKQYDIVLLDWEMPVKDGPSTLVEIREFNDEIPIMMVTTKNRPEDLSFAIENGANEYMMKPFTKEIINLKLSFIFDDYKEESA